MRMRLVYPIAIHTVVGQQDDERISPSVGILQFVDETPNALVQIVEGIEYLIVILADGYIPGLMAAQGGDCPVVSS